MGKIIDTAIALRVIYILVTPIETTNAFKLGLIDISGKTIKKSSTPEENAATNPLLRMCWNLKRIISIIPGGSTRIGSLAAAYLLMKESIENDWTERELSEQCLIRFEELCECECSEMDGLLEELAVLYEDAPANSTGSSVSTDIPIKKFALIKRKQLKSIEVK
jgi:hypothetical protein